MPSTPLSGATTSVQAQLLEMVEKSVRPQFQRNTMLYREFFNEKSGRINSRGYYIPVYLAPAAPGSWFGRREALGVSKPEDQARMQVNFVAYQKPFSFEGFTLEELKQPSSLLSFSQHMDRYRTDMEAEFSRFMYGNGSGAVGVVESDTGTAPTTITTDMDGSASSLGVGFVGAAWLEKNGIYEFVSPSTGAIRVSATASGNVTEFSPGALTATTFTTLDPSTGGNLDFNGAGNTLAANDLIVVAGTTAETTSATPSLSRAVAGFESHVVRAATTTYQGLNISTYPNSVLKSVVKDVSGASLTLGMITFIEHVVLFRRDLPNGGEDETMIIAPIGQKQRMDAVYNPFVRYQAGDQALRPGVKTIQNQYGNKWKFDSNAPGNTINHIRKADLALLEIRALDYMDNGSGGNLIPQSTTNRGGKAFVYDGWFIWGGQFAGKEPRNHAALTGLSVTDTAQLPTYHR